MAMLYMGILLALDQQIVSARLGSMELDIVGAKYKPVYRAWLCQALHTARILSAGTFSCSIK